MTEEQMHRAIDTYLSTIEDKETLKALHSLDKFYEGLISGGQIKNELNSFYSYIELSAQFMLKTNDPNWLVNKLYLSLKVHRKL